MTSRWWRQGHHLGLRSACGLLPGFFSPHSLLGLSPPSCLQPPSGGGNTWTRRQAHPRHLNSTKHLRHGTAIGPQELTWQPHRCGLYRLRLLLQLLC